MNIEAKNWTFEANAGENSLYESNVNILVFASNNMIFYYKSYIKMTMPAKNLQTANTVHLLLRHDVTKPEVDYIATCLTISFGCDTTLFVYVAGSMRCFFLENKCEG